MKSQFVSKTLKDLKNHDWKSTDIWMNINKKISEKLLTHKFVYEFLAQERQWDLKYHQCRIRSLIERFYGSQYERFSNGVRGRNGADIAIQKLENYIGMDINVWEELPGQTIDRIIEVCKELGI